MLYASVEHSRFPLRVAMHVTSYDYVSSPKYPNATSDDRVLRRMAMTAAELLCQLRPEYPRASSCMS